MLNIYHEYAEKQFDEKFFYFHDKDRSQYYLVFDLFFAKW